MNLGKSRHSLQVLFPIILFVMFTLSALTLVLLSANVYRSATENSYLNDSSRTCLSYISEKIHQHDQADAVALGTFDGCEALILRQEVGENTYYTYIYAYEDSLRELFLKEGAPAQASAGKAILAVSDFSMKALSRNLLHFSCTDSAGSTASATVGLRCSRTDGGA